MKIYQIDAFAAALFQGNPAAVVPLAEWLPDGVMQHIAMENNLAETAFIVPKGGQGASAGGGATATGGADQGADAMGKSTTGRTGLAGAGKKDLSGAGTDAAGGDYDYMIRWFTPTVEVELCGHATLASGQVVFGHLGFKGDVVVFRSLYSGDLKVSRAKNAADGDGAKRSGGTGEATKDNDGAEVLELDFPANMPELTGTGSGAAAGVRPEDHAAIFNGLRIAPRELYRGRHDFMVVLDSQEQVEELNPDFRILAGAQSRGVVVTARGRDVDFVSRCFFPQSGIDEDPVTGSAHTMMIPFWAGRLGRNRLSAIQLSRRRGYLDCRLAGDRVSIGGQAYTYLVGEIFVE
ncbi:MAG TPA: PhzF family phenazine biosynthesis protein [Puia sp.]|nr:PhzF family phenazine biosynthesis protein [Puia sp.]